MSQKLLRDSRLYQLLYRIDEDVAAETKADGCPCGGTLYVANYPRKPRGWIEALCAAWRMRLSFCCGREGCRRRRTPPSVRFLGRRLYLGVVIVLVAALREGVTSHRQTVIRAAIGASLATVLRWRAWWRETFPETSFWRAARGRLVPAVDEGRLPRSLLARFAGAIRERVIALLAFIAPLTTRDPRASTLMGAHAAQRMGFVGSPPGA